MVEITESAIRDIIGDGIVTDIGDKAYYISYKWEHHRGCAVFRAVPFHAKVDIDISHVSSLTFKDIGVYIAYPAREEYLKNVLSGDMRYRNNMDGFSDWDACYDVDNPQVWSSTTIKIGGYYE